MVRRQRQRAGRLVLPLPVQQQSPIRAGGPERAGGPQARAQQRAPSRSPGGWVRATRRVFVRGWVDGPARAPRLGAHQIPVTERVHGVVLVGDGNAATELLAAGVNDFVIFDREVTRAVFDDASDTWTLTADDGEDCRGRIVISCESPFVPWIPDLFGRRDFRGTAIHASMPETDFDPAGRHVAVIGPDSSAGELIDLMARSAATVKVFPLAPRRSVPRLGRTARFTRRRRIQVITSPVEEVTAVGVRTADGVHHDADAIVYGTGFAVRA